MRSDIESRLDRLEQSAPMTMDGVDFTIVDAPKLRATLGKTFTYFGRVEAEVAAEPLSTMMPRLGTSYRGYTSHGDRFLRIWVAQEHAHGLIFDRLQRNLGIDPETPDVAISAHNRIVGLVGRLSGSLHAVFEMIYLARGAMHERLTFQGYELMARKLDDLGEKPLLATMVKPIRRQEAAHLAYYRAAARELRSHLEPWQLWLARRLSIATYAPVGATKAEAKADFGHVAVTLAGDEIEEFSAPVQRLGEQLLAQRSRLPDFVVDAIERCVSSSRLCARLGAP